MLRSLESILTPSGFPRASGYHLFKDAYFGRDALEVAEDLLKIRPDIARAVIFRLASLQGAEIDPRTEEEPGKIHHEYRVLTMEGDAVDEASRAIFRQLARQWAMATTAEGLDALTEFIYYGTVDATPLYVRLVSEYAKQVDLSILDEPYTPRTRPKSGDCPTIRESLLRAVEWIVRKVEGSDLGLLEFQRMTSRGHRFQAWKDGTTSYVHVDGSFANYNAPIASIEVQGLAYDALMAAAALVGDSDRLPRTRLEALARRISEVVLDRFWMPDKEYFAMALDRDPATGTPRQVEVVTSNPAAMLESGIFDNVEPPVRRRVVSAIANRIYSSEFLTPVGIRCNSLKHQHVLDYMAYQSSYTVWHKETYDVATGLRRQGFPNLASDLEVRILNAVNIVGGATEFLYVMPDGRVDYHPFASLGSEAGEAIVGTNIPENNQAWSISAALAIKWGRGHSDAPSEKAEGWERELEERKRCEHPPAVLLRHTRDVVKERQRSAAFRLEAEEGTRRELAHVQAHELSTA